METYNMSKKTFRGWVFHMSRIYAFQRWLYTCCSGGIVRPYSSPFRKGNRRKGRFKGHKTFVSLDGARATIRNAILRTAANSGFRIEFEIRGLDFMVAGCQTRRKYRIRSGYSTWEKGKLSLEPETLHRHGSLSVYWFPGKCIDARCGCSNGSISFSIPYETHRAEIRLG